VSRTFQFTTDNAVGDEIEQHIYGKFGCTPSKALGEMVLAQMSKNPLTTQQFNRIVKRYGSATVISLEPLAVPLKGENR
jgi:hypothetical protein